MTACFTGHRADKIEFINNKNDARYIFLRSETIKTIEDLINQNYTHFIIGMSDGFDLLCGEILLYFKSQEYDIKIECAIPYREHYKRIKGEWKEIYIELLKKADKINYVSESYNLGCMFKRNKYMVDNSNTIVCYYNGKSGGTKNTLDYAKKLNKNIIYLR